MFTPPQILLVSDYFYAYLRREHHLTHGLYLKKKDGTEATLVLKWPSFTGLGDLTDCLTPHISALFFIVHSHYISFVSLLFSLFLSFAHLNVDPLLDQSCFVRDFLIMGADWRYLSDTELYYFGAHEVGTKLSFDLLVFHCFKGFIFFIKLHWKSEVVWLDVQFEVVVSRGHYLNVSDHKHWLQRAKTEDTSACLWTFYQRVTWRAGYVQIFSECFSWLRFF